MERVTLLTVMSLKDAFWISLFYLMSAMAFGVNNILLDHVALSLFIVICVLFSFFDERISIQLKRWEYTEKMPKVAKVGITPLIELALTGIITLYIVFGLFA